MATSTFKSVIDSWNTQIVHIFHSDWIDCRGTSPTLLLFVALCKRLNIVESNGHFTFESVIDSWGCHFDTILFFFLMRVVCVGSLVIVMLQKSKETSIRKNFKFN